MFETEVIGNCTLYRGDCIEVMPTLHVVDAVIGDPPYGTTNCKWDSIIPLDEMWATMPRTDQTPVILMAQTPFDKVLGCSNLRELRYEWVWEKTAATGHLNAKKMPMKAHENVLVFYRKLPTYNPQKTTGHIRKTASKDFGQGDRLQSDLYGAEKVNVSYDSTERYPRSVQKFASDKQRAALHPTQKPLALMEYLVRTYTNEGDTVLDFSMGSGTTGAACVRLGRKFIGIEKRQDYFDIASDRIRAEVMGMTDAA